MNNKEISYVIGAIVEYCNVVAHLNIVFVMNSPCYHVYTSVGTPSEAPDWTPAGDHVVFEKRRHSRAWLSHAALQIPALTQETAGRCRKLHKQ